VDLAQHIESERAAIDAELDRLLPPADAWPPRLHAAMRYAVLGGGKRVRPILVRAVCRAAGGDPALALAPGCALELVHSYSLVHDDLPALDDDTLRRGRPTVHVAWGEALAIMVGDALLTEGFAVLARHPEGAAHAALRAEACTLVAAAIGSRGMVGGQVEDLEATGADAAGAAGAAARLDRIHRAKTGALIAAAVELGALIAGAAGERRRAWRELGERLGLLFQIADDILDVTGTAASLGKSPGKDAAAGKLTYPAVHGLTAARRRLEALAGELAAAARALAGENGVLTAIVDYVARRER
jgi:geranylgeranyl diphosphate synthase type II